MFPANKVVTNVILRTAFTVATTSTYSTSSNSFIFLRSYMSRNAMLNRNRHAYVCKNRFLNSCLGFLPFHLSMASPYLQPVAWERVGIYETFPRCNLVHDLTKHRRHCDLQYRWSRRTRLLATVYSSADTCTHAQVYPDYPQHSLFYYNLRSFLAWNHALLLPLLHLDAEKTEE